MCVRVCVRACVVSEIHWCFSYQKVTHKKIVSYTFINNASYGARLTSLASNANFANKDTDIARAIILNIWCWKYFKW